MKVALIFILFVAYAYAYVSKSEIENLTNTPICNHDMLKQEKIGEDKIREALENLKTQLCAGNEAAGIPSFNPLKINYIPVDIDNEAIKAKIEISDLELSGIPDFDVMDGLKFSIIGYKLKLPINYPRIAASLNYVADIHLFDTIHIEGAGDLKIELTNLGLALDISLQTWGEEKYIAIKSLKLNLTLESTKFVITGLQNDEAISASVSQSMSEILPQLIKEKQQWLDDMISPMLLDFINVKINKLITLEDLISGFTKLQISKIVL